MKVVVFIGLILFVASCKKNSSTITKSEELIISDYLTVSIKGKLIEDDVLEVYFAENIRDQYNVRDKLRVSIEGSMDFQNIVFKLPERVYPMKLRIDLGTNNHETPVEIMEIKLSTGGKNKIIKANEIKKFFRSNQYIETKPESNKFLRRKVNGVYDPFLLSGDLTEITVDLFSK